MTALLAGISVSTLSVSAQNTARDVSAPSYMAGVLANDARATLANPDLAPKSAAAQAAILLKFATDLDPSDLRVQRLLSQVAQVAEMTDLRRQALRAIIQADTGHLVAQVEYIDMLAAESQTYEQKARLYQAALDQRDLDPQIKSEMALRLARLAEDRGETVRAKEFLSQAIRHNSVNVGALRDMVRLTAGGDGPETDADTMRALATLLTANPYQADAWHQAARLAAGANLHDRAADFLQTSYEQAQLDGALIDGDLLLELVIEQAAAGRRAEAFKNATALANATDAPLTALLVAHLLSQDNPPAPAFAAETQAGAERWLAEVRRQLVAMAKDVKPENASLLADVAGVDLTMLPDVGVQTGDWLAAYEKTVQPNDPTLLRLKGWMLYRTGKIDEARATLEKAPADPIAQLGRARILIDQGNKTAAAALLQGLYATHPTGLLAFQVTRTAHKAGIALLDTPAAIAMRQASAALTPAVVSMHRHTRDIVMMSAAYRNSTANPDEPVYMSIRISSVSDKPLPVGPDGVIKTAIALADTTRTIRREMLGIYGVEDIQRVYRLEPRQMMEAIVRVDQGKVADMLERDLSANQSVGVSAVMAARVVSGSQFSMGLGGQMVSPGDFDRRGIGDSATDPARLESEITTMAGSRQLVRIMAAGHMLKKEEKLGLSKAMMQLAASPAPLVRASVARLYGGVDLLADPDPIVRLFAAKRLADIVPGTTVAALEARKALEKRAAVETDASLKQYLAAVLSASDVVPDVQPATRPAAQPGNN